MPLPSVNITKSDGNTGAVGPSPIGVLAIIAPSATGTQNQAQAYFRQDLALADRGDGPLVEYAAYDMAIAGKPVLLITPSTSTPASYGAIGGAITGTMVPTTPAATTPNAPLDDWNFVLTFTVGGTIGTPGIQYTFSFDGGVTTSAPQSLGSANFVTPPIISPQGTQRSSGVRVNFGAGTVNAGDTITIQCLHARMTNADLLAALEALRVSGVAWEGVLVDGEIGTGTVALVDTWLQAREKEGKFRFAYLNTRHKNLPVPSAETEGAFATAMTTLVAAQASIRLGVGTDAGDFTSLVTGFTLPRPTALAICARAMLIPIGEDPAYVARGNISGVTIADANQNPKWHDEALYPGLDDIRLSTLRTVNGSQGVYITDALMLSPTGSDFVFLQHARCMNRACEVAFQILTKQLGLGVRKQPKDPTTGKIFILEADAQRIETLVNDALKTPMKGQVNDFAFVLSRTDDLSANSGATVNGEIQIQALAYVKAFTITAKFVKTITVNI